MKRRTMLPSHLMVKSSHMTVSLEDRDIRGHRASSAWRQPASFNPMVAKFGFLLLILSASTMLSAQQTPLSDSSQSGGADCSDPLTANSSLCSGQNYDQENSQSGSRLRIPLSGQYGSQPRNSGIYSDTENMSRQSSGRNQSLPIRLPLEPLTEFQKFVASTISQILPIYGADLFRNVPSTFAPLDMSPVPPDFVIGPGDELRIRVWGQVAFQANVTVDRSGEVYLPQIGPVHVSGMPFSALNAQLRSAIGRVYRNFDLTVDVGQIRAIQVYVAGHARRPGVYTVSSLSTLVDALFASGGPSVQGSLRHIQLRRGNAVVTDFDLYNLLTNGDKSKDVKLLAGDVVFIPAVGPQVAITGSVPNSAIFELRDDETLTDLLADAGGVSALAAETRISIERIEAHHDRHAMEVAYDKAGLATPLTNGDLVRVYSIVPTYRKTVILRGNTANAGRFAWHPGMRVSELIPDKDSLITRNYWWRRTQLGLPTPEFEPTPGFSNLRQPAESHPVTLWPLNGQGSSNQARSQQNESGMQQEDLGYPLNGNALQRNDNASQTDQSGIPQGQTGLLQDQIGSQQDQDVRARQRPSSSSLAASEANRPNRFAAPPQRTETRLLAPEVDWNYAAIERLDPETLKTTIIPFDLGNLVLRHDLSQDIELQPGDVVSIFSEADIRVPIAQQTKLVKLEGEFVHAGSYTVQPGETLRHLIERAGGFTPSAYLYGSEFARESTRAVQQARIDEYVRSLDMQIQRSNLATAAAPPSATQDFLTRLRQIRATGRIVLEFKAESTSTSALPDITMEDGDSFVVPPVPASINVVGAVYDQNSFLYVRSRRVGAYLHLAGGPNREADRRHEFIIRSDGEVISRETSGGPWGDRFDNLRMYPGDTIVVPDKTYKPSVLRGISDWSNLFSQLALGAAALSVLHF